VLLFAFQPYEAIGGALRRCMPELRQGSFTVSRFDNGELRVDIATPAASEACLVLGSIAPPDGQMLSALLLIHTLKKEGAGMVTAVFPYLAYARQDKHRAGQSMATPWAGALLAACGTDRLIAVDVHSERSRKMFQVPVVSVSPAELFAAAIRDYGLSGATLVAPDEGAIARCEAVKAAAGLPPSRTPYFEKHRSDTGIVHSDLMGEAGRRVVIVDDILDTGTTLLSACERLAKAGVEEIQIMATHGLFTGTRWRDLWEFGVTRIFITDTVPGAPQDRRIVTLPVAPLLKRAIYAD
jgi:ribose-phosphate pyrophosphokinase